MIYSTPVQITKNTKVTMMQYKILHRILAVNRNLKKWKVTESDLCHYCNHIDTIDHFLFLCPNTTLFWQSVFTWWKSLFEFSLNLTVLEIIFGIPNVNEDIIINMYNMVILYAKYYIYVTKKTRGQLQLFEFILDLKQELILKRNYQAENNRLKSFNRKWGELYDLLC